MLEEARLVMSQASWTSVELDFMQGRRAPEKFLGQGKTNGEKTEAHTDAGFKDAVAGRVDRVLEHLRWVWAEGARNHVDDAMAKGELEQASVR